MVSSAAKRSPGGTTTTGRARLLAAAALLVASNACFSTTAGLAPDSVSSGGGIGTFALSGPGLASGEIVPSRCAAGDRERFLGADLVDGTRGLVVRLVIDPLEGPALRVHSLDAPWDRGGVIFLHESCARFEMSFQPTGWIVNDVVVRDLTLAVDCENEEGATLRGEAAARCD